jgi:TolB protein
MKLCRRIPRALAVIGGVTLVVAACGGDSEPPAPTATPAPPQPIVYEGRADQTVNVYIIDPVTGVSTQLTFEDSFDANPGWSPDYSRIIFTSDRAGERNDNDLYTMRADGSDVQRLVATPGEAEYSPRYSRDGSRIGYAVRREDGYYVASMASDGTDIRMHAGPFDFAEFPAWSADGSELFVAMIEPGLTQGADIMAVHITTGAVRTVVSTPAADVCPHVSRDGTKLTYATAVGDGEQDIYEHDLALGDTSGASDRQLTSNPARDDYSAPSPDGSQFVFLSNRDGNMELYLMNADGSGQRRLTNTPDLRENVPDW